MKRSLIIVGVVAGAVNFAPAYAAGGVLSKTTVRVGDGALRDRISDRLDLAALNNGRLRDAVDNTRDRLDDARDNAKDRREDRRDKIDDRLETARDRIGDARDRLADVTDNLGESELLVRQTDSGVVLANNDGTLSTALRSGLRTTVVLPSN